MALERVWSYPPECRGVPDTTVRRHAGPSTRTTAATSAARRATTRTTAIATVDDAGAGKASCDLTWTPLNVIDE